MLVYSLLGAAALLCAAALHVQADVASNLPFATSWLSTEKRTELDKVESSKRGKFLVDVYDSATPAEQTTIRGEVVPKCYASWTTDAQREELEKLHDANEHEQCRVKVKEMIAALPQEKQQSVEGYWPFCEHVWYKHSSHAGHKHGDNHEHHHMGRRHAGRHTRHVHQDISDFAKEHLTWMTDAEREDVMKQYGDSKQKGRERVFEIFNSATGEKREKALAQLQTACRELIVEVLGEDGAKQLRTLKESGVAVVDMKLKIGELLDGVTDGAKKAKAAEYRDACERIYAAVSRRRRDSAHHHALESKLKSEWAWLTTEQKDEIRQLKTSGKNDEVLLTKVFEFFKNADRKDEAEDGLQTSCSSAILTILGPEKAEKLKTFMANGAAPAVYEAKVKELLNEADKSGSAKKSLTKNQESCKHVFVSASRFRREGHTQHTLEDHLKSHLSWLTDGQKATVRKLKVDGKPDEVIQAEVIKFYEIATGETKTKATAGLQAGCKEVLESVIGADNVAELTKMKASGASGAELGTKIDTYVAAVTDEEKLKRGRKFETQCKKLYGVAASRRLRRQVDHEHTLEELVKTHLSWLTDAQKDTLRKLKAENKGEDAIQAETMKFYEAATGETKTKATAGLQAGCKEVLELVIGADNVAEISKMKASGASNAEIGTKIDTYVAAVTDQEKLKRGRKFETQCKKLYGVAASRRLRRHDHEGHEHMLEGYLSTHLDWLTEEQKTAVRALKAEGKGRKEMYAEVFKYFDAAPASQREKATTKMQAACREEYSKLMGADNASELKKMRESGSSDLQLREKANEYISAITDVEKKKTAEFYKDGCQKVFGVAQ